MPGECSRMDTCTGHMNLSFSVLMAIFPHEPGLSNFIDVKDDGGGGNNWS